jgi:hypothetical protein
MFRTILRFCAQFENRTLNLNIEWQIPEFTRHVAILTAKNRIARSVLRFNGQNENLALKWEMFQIILPILCAI